jgi:2,3-bisphosphoglycerate-independent phosphoglycerate mutase
MHEDDEVIMFNFRKDRPQQIVAALSSKEFTGFDRGETARPNITCMMPYNKQYELDYVFEPDKPAICLAQIISDSGLRQFHCSETEKYPHVTYFFNGGRTAPFSGETQLLIPSPKVATYDQKPEMSAREISDAVGLAIKAERYDFIVVNFANGDMVGHTAKEDAVIQAVEVLDEQVGKLIQVAVSNDYSVILTADHGNCEELIDPTTGMPHTQHTMYPVPCMIIDKSSWQLSCAGGLANIAPTVLQLMGVDIPKDAMEKSLLIKEKSFPVHTRNLDFVA